MELYVETLDEEEKRILLNKEILTTSFRKLGYSVEHWEILEQDLRNQILSRDVVKVSETQYGLKFIIEGDLTGPADKTVRIVTVWVIIKGEDSPRFITAYPGG